MALYVYTQSIKKVSLTKENGVRMQVQHSRISLTELNGKENVLSLRSYTSLNMATFAYLSMFNIRFWED